MDTTARDLFEKLKGQFKNLTLGREDGTRTLIPGEASFFEFDYHNDESKLGSVVVSLVDESSLKVYFANNIMDDADTESKDNWYGFLRGLRKFATQNMLNYEAKNISKQRLDKGDFEYLSKQNKTEEELTMESKLYGSRQKSYQDLNGAKLIVQHTKTVDEDKMGSRSRNIRAVYIENSDGERFKFENNYLPGARAMARHVSNGGYPRDEFGTHISEIMSEMTELRTFVRGVKGKDDYVNEDAQDIIEKATGRYYGLKSTLESVSKQRGYTDYFENYEPTAFEVSEDDINDLKTKLTREVFDGKLENSLGAVSKAMKYNDQLQEKKSDGEYNDYPQWEKAAKREKADIIDGDIGDLDKNQEVTMYKIAMSGDEELGSWIQYQKDLDDPKVGQSVTIPGYGEFAAQAGDGDRGETDEREFTVPSDIEVSGEQTMQILAYKGKSNYLSIILADIADRAVDDEVMIFASNLSQKIASVGDTFGQDPKDPAYQADKKKAVALAKIHLKHNVKLLPKKEDEAPFEETTKTDPFEAYAESMDSIVNFEGTAQASLKSVMALDKKNAENKKQSRKDQKQDDANRKSNRAAGMVSEAYINTPKDAIDTLGNLRKIGKSIETGQGIDDNLVSYGSEPYDNLANMYANDVNDVLSWLDNNADTNDPKYKQIVAPVMELLKKAKGMERKPGSGKDAQFGNEIVNTLYPLMQWIEMNVEVEVKEAAKPDFLDIDGDGDKKEPMKKAVKDKKKVEEAEGETIHAWWETQKGPGDMGGQALRYFKKNEDYDPDAEGLRNGPYFTPSLDWWPSVEDFEQGKQGFSNKTKDDAEGWEIHDLKSDALSAIKGTDEGNEFSGNRKKAIDAGEDELNVGDEVKKDGYPGIITKVHTGQLSGMVDVKTSGGTSTVSISDVAKGEVEEDNFDSFESPKAVEEEDDMAWLRKAAGIGSGAKSNHGIHEGEEGYQITPRSLVAREMRKLQDLAKD